MAAVRKNKSENGGGRRLPPLNALRAFEAAARHLSFARAAQELYVTPAAVSHQIKALEEQLGVRLFRRLTRGLELTGAGQVAQPKLREGFDRLAEAMEELHAHEDANVLSVSVAPTLTTKWLMPRLHRFVAAHPDLDVRITASTRLIDGIRRDGARGSEPPRSPLEDADIAVRFGSGTYPGFRVDRLHSVSVTPVCSPRLMAGDNPLRLPDDLRRQVLIHENVTFNDGRRPWDLWLEAAGITGIDTSHGLRFSHAVLALEAAADGLGVALAMPLVAATDLAAGRLVAPFELRVPLDYAYHVVCPEATCERPDVVAFRDWLFAEAKRDAAG